MSAGDPGPRTLGVSLKMYFTHERTVRWCTEVAELAARHPAVTSGAARLFVLPSFVSIPAAVRCFAGTGVAVGAQDVCWADEGAFTGEVSGGQLRELGCAYVAVGHAERRRLFGETEEVVAAKVAAALRHGLEPVVCVGEPARGDPVRAARCCLDELDSALRPARAAGLTGAVTVAYEPHWAIGATGPAPAGHVRTVCAALRAHTAADPAFDVRVVYGGTAGAGLLSRLGGDAHGLFLGRRAHDPSGLAAVLDEVSTRPAGRGPITPDTFW